MRVRAISPLLFLAAAAGCASAGAGGGSSMPALAYESAAPETLRYSQGDSVLVIVDAGGQTIEVNVDMTAMLDMTFSPTPEGVGVSAVYVDLDGRATNPMTGTETVTEDDVEGPVVFTLDRRGVGTLIEGPELGTVAASMVNAASMAGAFFPRLPGRAVAAGEMWTDTVDILSDEAGTRIESRSVVAYTVVGETTVDGQALLRVDFASEDTRNAEVNQGGMEVFQAAEGTTSGFFLWDLAEGRLHSQVYDGEMVGSMEVAMAPFPLGMRMELRGRTTLVPSG